MGDVFAFFHDLVAAQLSQDQILFCKKKNVVASKNSFNPLHRGCFARTQQRPQPGGRTTRHVTVANLKDFVASIRGRMEVELEGKKGPWRCWFLNY